MCVLCKVLPKYCSDEDLDIEATARRFTVEVPFDALRISDGTVKLTLDAEGLEKLISVLGTL